MEAILRQPQPEVKGEEAALSSLLHLPPTSLGKGAGVGGCAQDLVGRWQGAAFCGAGLCDTETLARPVTASHSLSPILNPYSESWIGG